MNEQMRLTLLNVLTAHDIKESKGKRYNPYALGQYFQALDRASRYVAMGHDLRLALLNCFNGRLLDKLLKAAELPVSTKEECYVGGYAQLPELDD